MSDENTGGQGEDQKNQGGEGEDENVIKLSKEELSNKIIGGRDEGIQKGTKDAIGAINETLGTEFEDLESLKDGLSEAHIGDITESEVVQTLQGKLAEKDEKIENLSKKMQDIRIKDSVQGSLSEFLGDKELLVDFDDLKMLHDSNLGADYAEKDGEVFIVEDGSRVLNDDGDYMTYSESLYNFAKGKNWIKGNKKGGAGGGTSAKRGGSDNPFETGNITEQAKMWQRNPEKARRLQESAKG